MNELYSFYSSILNIDNADKKETIMNIVAKEKYKLLQSTNSVEGFCKYIANQIEYEIKRCVQGVHVFYVDLNELVNIDHVVLIIEYMCNNEIKRLLVDPTFVQFITSDDNECLKCELYSREKDEDNLLVIDIFSDGICEVDNVRFNKYLNYFSCNQRYVNLDEYLFNKRLYKSR